MMFSKFWNFGHDKNSSRRTPRLFKNVENGDFQPFLGHILGNRCWPNVTQGSEGHFKGFRDEKYDLWASQNRIERLHTTSWVSPRYLYFLVTQKNQKFVLFCAFSTILRKNNQMSYEDTRHGFGKLWYHTFQMLKSVTIRTHPEELLVIQFIEKSRFDSNEIFKIK